MVADPRRAGCRVAGVGELRPDLGLRVFFDCVARGIPAFSPHAIGAFPTTWEIARPRWLAYDCAVIDRCTHVLMLPRWETSPGAVAERDYALRIGTPVITSLEELEAT